MGKGVKRVKSFRLDDMTIHLIGELRKLLNAKRSSWYYGYSEGEVVEMAIRDYYNKVSSESQIES